MTLGWLGPETKWFGPKRHWKGIWNALLGGPSSVGAHLVGAQVQITMGGALWGGPRGGLGHESKSGLLRYGKRRFYRF